MSLIGLLTATEKQVHLGRLHMRTIQWHLKNNWRVPESLEKVITIPRSLYPYLRWWLKESNVFPGQPLHYAPGGTSQKWTCLPPDSTTNFSTVCVTGSRPQAWAVYALSQSWENLDPYAFPPAAILGKVVKLQDYPCNRIILIAPGWPNMPWDLVAMSSQIPLCLPNLPNLISQPFHQTQHRNLSNLNLHAWLLEPQQSRSGASLRQWQHELRLLKADQPRSVYEPKWTIFTKWCLSNQVDSMGPPLKAIADFLFQDRKLKPGTIDGYRSAIANKLVNSTINLSKDENLTRLLDSFHRERPKGRRGMPSWNLSLVLHQLTKGHL